MNKFVLEHYPAAKLRRDIRGGIDADASVRVTVEVETDSEDLTFQNLLERTRAIQARGPGTTIEEATARIRALRDEWDD